MLPLSKPSEAVLAALNQAGIAEDTITAALSLDLLPNGSFGTAWLLLSIPGHTLYRVTEDSGEIQQYSLDHLHNPYIDNYTASCRILAHLSDKPIPKDCEGAERDELIKSCTTISIGECTNACKSRLAAFLQIWERMIRGNEITEEDPLFAQFNMKCPKCGRPYKNPYHKVCPHCTEKKGTIWRVLTYFKPFKWQFITVLGCLVFTSVISLLTPILSGKLLFDQVISKPSYNEAGEMITGRYHSMEALVSVVGLIFAMAIVSLIIGIIQSRATATMAHRVVATMKKDVFAALQKLSFSYFNQNPTGRLQSRVNTDAMRIRNFFINGVPQLIIHSLNFIGLSIFLFSINWQLTLIVFVPVPIIVLIFRKMLPKLWHSHSISWRRSSALNTMMSDSFTGVRVVKAFSKENEESSRFAQYAKRLADINLHTNLIALTTFPVVSLLIGMSSQTIWGFGGIQVMGNAMTYGELTTYLGYTGMIFTPLNFFSTFTNLLTETNNAATRMFETLDTVPDIQDAPDAVSLPSIQDKIKFDHVYFHYNPSRTILKDISFEIKAGDHVGIVGHTGSGKSTVANLILRMYDVISGSISIDGTDIKKIRIADLRRNIAIVSQEIYLFRGTIAENIRYARPEATMEEVIAAARAAGAHDFIMNLPEGYQTMIGGGSRSLSGGERQRVSIARALLLSPSLLILDEATAAMDTETERQISEAIDRLIEGRTTITIAHRLSTLKNCDYLMAIENGELAEIGTHEELIAKQGVFYRLYTLQSEQLERVKSGQ
jgi:ATP-binding cassette subfamily B protein